MHIAIPVLSLCLAALCSAAPTVEMIGNEEMAALSVATIALAPERTPLAQRDDVVVHQDDATAPPSTFQLVTVTGGQPVTVTAREPVTVTGGQPVTVTREPVTVTAGEPVTVTRQPVTITAGQPVVTVTGGKPVTVTAERDETATIFASILPVAPPKKKPAEPEKKPAPADKKPSEPARPAPKKEDKGAPPADKDTKPAPSPANNKNIAPSETVPLHAKPTVTFHPDGREFHQQPRYNYCHFHHHPLYFTVRVSGQLWGGKNVTAHQMWTAIGDCGQITRRHWRDPDCEFFLFFFSLLTGLSMATEPPINRAVSSY